MTYEEILNNRRTINIVYLIILYKSVITDAILCLKNEFKDKG